LHSITFNSANPLDLEILRPTYTFSGATVGATLRLLGDVTFTTFGGNATFDNTLNIALNGGNHTVDVGETGASVSVAGVIGDASVSDHAKITLTGSGSLTLTGANTFTGGVEVQSGELIVGNSSALGTGTVTLHGNTEFSPSASVTIANPIVLVGDGALVDNEDGGSNNMTLTGLISGIGGFDWCAPGTLTLSNSTSTFSGGVEMREGTLYVGGNSSGGVNNAVTSGPLGIGDVDLEDSTVLAASTASAFIGNFIFLDDGRVQFGDNDNHSLTLAGTISGFGEVTFRGGSGGTLILSGDNDFGGSFMVESGTLLLGSSSVFHPAHGDFLAFTSSPVGDGNNLLKLLDGATLGVAVGSGSILLENDIALCNTGTGVVIDTTNGNLELSGNISGSNSIIKNGGGMLTLSGDNGFTGNITLNSGGPLVFSDDSNLGQTPEIFSAAALTFNGGILENSAFVTLNARRGLTLLAAGGTIQTDGTDDPNSPTVFAIPGVITGPGALTKAGPGFLNLIAANTYTGGTKISGGYLSLGDGESTGSIVGNVQLLGTDTIGGGELRFDEPSSYAFNGNITGTGRISLFGPSTITLGGTNTFVGGTYIHDGTLADSGGGNFSPSSDVFIRGGAGLQVNHNETVGGLEGYFDGESTTFGTVAINAGTLTINTSGSSSFAGVISGAGALAKSGIGTQSLNGNNTFTGGTALNAGTLYIGNPSSLGTGTLTVAGGSTFGLGGPISFSNGIVLSGGTANMDIDGDSVLSGIVSGSGIMNLISSGSLHFTLSGANNGWTGGLNIAGDNQVILGNSSLGSGVLSFDPSSHGSVDFTGATPSIGGLSASGSGSEIEMGVGAVLTINQNSNSTYAGHIDAGTGASLVKSGSGTLTLTNTNLYTGGTTITGGTLVYGANGAFGSGSVTINGGDVNVAGGFSLTNPLVFSGPVTLGGNGSFGTLITAGPGVTLSPGNSPGTLSFTAGLVFAGGGSLTFQVEDANGSAGSGYDLLAISGAQLNITATSGSPFMINLVSLDGGGNPGAVGNFNSSSAYTWTIATSSSGIANFNANKFNLNLGSFSNSLNGGTFAITDSGSLLALQFTPNAVPEPSTWVMLSSGLGLAALARWRRRRE